MESPLHDDTARVKKHVAEIEGELHHFEEKYTISFWTDTVVASLFSEVFNTTKHYYTHSGESKPRHEKLLSNKLNTWYESEGKNIFVAMLTCSNPIKMLGKFSWDMEDRWNSNMRTKINKDPLELFDLWYDTISRRLLELSRGDLQEKSDYIHAYIKALKSRRKTFKKNIWIPRAIRHIRDKIDGIVLHGG